MKTNAPVFSVSRQKNAAKLSLASNVLLVILKITAGVASGAISVLAEGVQSSIDVLASLIIIWTVQAAASPPDQSHPYGHGKLESLAALGQMILISLSAFYILSAAMSRWMNPVQPHFGWGASALFIALVVNFFVSRHLQKVAEETHSQALLAEAAHLRSDMLSCGGVLIGLGATWYFGIPRLDPLIAGIMAIVVIASAVKLGRETLRPLLDEKLPADEEFQIQNVLEADPRVLAYHRLRTRQAGASRLMDVHVLLDDELSFSASHAISEEIEDAIRRVLPNLDVIVHAEPFHEEEQHQREAHAEFLKQTEINAK